MSMQFSKFMVKAVKQRLENRDTNGTFRVFYVTLAKITKISFSFSANS